MSTCTRCVKKVYARGMCDVHYGQWRRRQQAYGRTTSMYVDAGPVREHIEALSAAGVSYKRLHKLSGVALSSIARIVTGRTEREEGPAKQVHRGVADRILAVPLPGVWWAEASDHRVGDGVGTRRRLQALVAMGWSQSEIARRLGVDPANATKLFRCVLVHAVTARRVAGLYDELSMTHGGSRRALNVAAREGWLRPLDWDDDLIDGPEHFRWARTSTGRRWAA